MDSPNPTPPRNSSPVVRTFTDYFREEPNESISSLGYARALGRAWRVCFDIFLDVVRKITNLFRECLGLTPSSPPEDSVILHTGTTPPTREPSSFYPPSRDGISPNNNTPPFTYSTPHANRQLIDGGSIRKVYAIPPPPSSLL